jgi:hypothetical protein
MVDRQRFPFMREFNGVPLELDQREQTHITAAFLKTAQFIGQRYAEHADRGPVVDGSYDLQLFLHAPEARELLSLDAVFGPQNSPLFACIGLTALGESSAESVHSYSGREHDQVIRHDETDPQAEFEMGLLSVQRRIEKLDSPEGTPPVPRQPQPRQPLDELARGAVDLDEVRGLRRHLEARTSQGLYAPISFETYLFLSQR